MNAASAGHAKPCRVRLFSKTWIALCSKININWQKSLFWLVCFILHLNCRIFCKKKYLLGVKGSASSTTIDRHLCLQSAFFYKRPWLTFPSSIEILSIKNDFLERLIQLLFFDTLCRVRKRHHAGLKVTFTIIGTFFENFYLLFLKDMIRWQSASYLISYLLLPVSSEYLMTTLRDIFRLSFILF